MTDAAAERIKQIKELVRKEKQLREDIAAVRRDRKKLRSDPDYPGNEARPTWLAKMPKEFWYPSHLMAKIISESTVGKDQAYIYPDLEDWAEHGTTWDAVINIGAFVCVVVTTLQIFFILL